VQPLRLDVRNKGLLQIGKIVAGWRVLIRPVIRRGDVKREPPLVGAGEEKLPLRIGRFRNAGRQQMREVGRRDRRGQAPLRVPTTQTTALQSRI
jgi:hypothetical protein